MSSNVLKTLKEGRQFFERKLKGVGAEFDNLSERLAFVKSERQVILAELDSFDDAIAFASKTDLAAKPAQGEKLDSANFVASTARAFGVCETLLKGAAPKAETLKAEIPKAEIPKEKLEKPTKVNPIVGGADAARAHLMAVGAGTKWVNPTYAEICKVTKVSNSQTKQAIEYLGVNEGLRVCRHMTGARQGNNYTFNHNIAPPIEGNAVKVAGRWVQQAVTAAFVDKAIDALTDRILLELLVVSERLKSTSFELTTAKIIKLVDCSKAQFVDAAKQINASGDAKIFAKDFARTAYTIQLKGEVVA